MRDVRGVVSRRHEACRPIQSLPAQLQQRLPLHVYGLRGDLDQDRHTAELVFRGGRAEEPTALAGATDLLARTLFGATWPEDLQSTKGQGHLDGLLNQEEGLLEALRLERLRLRRDPAAPSQLPGLEASLASLQARLRAQGSTRALEDVYFSQGGSQGPRQPLKKSVVIMADMAMASAYSTR